MTAPQTWLFMLAACVVTGSAFGDGGNVVVIAARPHRLRNAQAVAVSPDGKLVAAGFGGPSNARFPLQPRAGGVIVWDAEMGEVKQSRGEYGDVIGLSFLSSGDAWLHARVYTPGDSIDDNVSRVVSVSSGKVLATWSWHDTHVSVAAPTQPVVAVVNGRGICRLFSFEDGKAGGELRTLKIDDDCRNARTLAFSPDGGTLVAVHEVLEPIVRADGTRSSSRRIIDKGLAVFDTQTWKLRKRTVDPNLRGATALAVSPGGRWIATGHNGGIARIRDGRSLELVREVDLKTPAAVLPRFSPDGTTLALLTQPANGPTWKYADTPSGFEFGRKQTGTNCDLLLLDSNTFERRRHFRFEDGTFRTYHANNPTESRNPSRLAFTPDGKHILVGCNGVSLIDAETGRVVKQFDANEAGKGRP